jgi:hypothetical protein
MSFQVLWKVGGTCESMLRSGISPSPPIARYVKAGVPPFDYYSGHEFEVDIRVDMNKPGALMRNSWWGFRFCGAGILVNLTGLERHCPRSRASGWRSAFGRLAPDKNLIDTLAG